MDGRAWARAAGWAGTAGAWAALFVVQARTGDWLPAELSMSQYGVGPSGWIFALVLLCSGLAPLAWWCCSPRTRGSLVLLGIGAAGSVVAALVPTEPGGLQETLAAKIHMGGSVLLVVFVPLGLRLLVRHRSRSWRIAADVLFWISAAALVLLLAAAFGLDTAGLGPQRSWAWWQTVAALAQLALLTLVGAGLGRVTSVAQTGSRMYGR